MIIYSEVYTINTKVDIESKFDADEFEIDYKYNLESKVTHNKSLLLSSCLAKQYVLVLPNPHPAKYYILEDTVSIIEFDIMCLSPLADLVSATIDQKFLINMVNWGYRSI